jgi:chromosome segregation protein
VAARLEDTVAQEADVAGSIATLKRTLGHIDDSCRKQFLATFEALDEKIAHVFATLFGGGTARLELVGEDPLEAGVDIVAQPPGKRLAHLSLLSGGEKAMAATALLFALHLLRPSPFYLLDELDAALDDANVERLNRLLQELAEQSQIIVVTHNKRTLEMADTLYGVTMEEPGVSKLVSVRLSELSQAEGQS